ncbi:flagellar biosynthesis protein FlgN [Sulfitobacter sp. JB4-11]|uniref:flagellar biosynthesis protein FlgN n=1 Tax=Sulfitobacter rhodophyticola TaxID=3238304 RepID=UPI00351826CE
MTDDKTKNTERDGVVALNTLLDAEREALLQGDLESLADMLPTKEALIEDMNEAPPADIAAVQALGGKVRRNQLLLDGALEGIRAAVKRMAEMREIRAGLETYGADGQKRQIATDATNSVEKRA